jgi:hypothetical protein
MGVGIKAYDHNITNCSTAVVSAARPIHGLRYIGLGLGFVGFRVYCFEFMDLKTILNSA